MPKHQGAIATIGNFDGVHIGHQTILRQMQTIASERGLKTLIMIFEPQPREFFLKEQAPRRLTVFRDKVHWLNHHGVDYVLRVKFDENLSLYSADQFIQELLINKLQVKHLVIGDDFKFGCDRRGDFALLAKAGQQHGFPVQRTETIDFQQERISSTRIREVLSHCEFVEAKRMLGRPYYLSGRVIQGRQLGRELGFATANIAVDRQQMLFSGVFAVKVTVASGEIVNGVANLGVRPTVQGETLLLENHLFDFTDDLYQQRIQVEFCHKIRDEQHFPDLQALKQQIQQDCVAAKRFFNQA